MDTLISYMVSKLRLPVMWHFAALKPLLIKVLQKGKFDYTCLDEKIISPITDLLKKARMTDSQKWLVFYFYCSVRRSGLSVIARSNAACYCRHAGLSG